MVPPLIVMVPALATPPPSSAAEPFFILGRAIDIIFILDMCIQFFLLIPKENEPDTWEVRGTHATTAASLHGRLLPVDVDRTQRRRRDLRRRGRGDAARPPRGH